MKSHKMQKTVEQSPFCSRCVETSLNWEENKEVEISVEWLREGEILSSNVFCNKFFAVFSHK